MKPVVRLPVLLIAASLWAQPAAPGGDAARLKRERELKIAEVVEALGPVKGGRVADIGAGEGEYEPALSNAAGSQGRVYAEDIAENALKQLREKVKNERLGNVDVIEGTAENPKLPPNLDGVLMVLCYHHFEQPRKMLDRVLEALLPGGRLVLVEMHPNRTLSRPRTDQIKNHVIAPDLVESEVRDAGFEVVSRDDHFIDRPDEESTRWMIVFRKPAPR